MKAYKVTGKGSYDFRLGLNTTVNAPTPTEFIVIPVGSIVYHESTAPNGNVWFSYNGKRGKAESGCIENIIEAEVLEAKRG